MAYLITCKLDLPIYGVKPKGLKDFTTSQNDAKKGITRIPLNLARLKEEDTLAAGSLAPDDMENEIDFDKASFDRKALFND